MAMDSEIKTFYKNLNILITGGTGLFGQLLIEKLLRVCTDVEGIYLILRPKKGTAAVERINVTTEGPLFDKLRETNPDFAKKIHVLDGDCSHLELGLNDPSRKTLIDKIDVVFHCAATLNMEAKLEDAVNTNIRGLQEMLALCQQMTKLKSMVFVSTAYSNSIHEMIEEKFYEPPLKPDTIVKLAYETDDEILCNITLPLIDKWPNTYCYSKAIAEDLIRQNLGALPVAVFRPSIVMPTYNEPVPGWTSNVYGPIGYFLASGLGVSRVTYCNPDGKIDFIPADLCINALICTAWEVHRDFNSKNKSLPIYNYSGRKVRNLSMTQMMDYAVQYEYPFKNAIWATTHTLTSNIIYYKILQLFLHYIPGLLMDLYFFLKGKKMRMMRAYEKLSKMENALSFFSHQEWNIVSDNTSRLWSRLNDKDQELFPFDMNIVNYKKFILDCVLGIKIYILKEPLDNVEEEKKRYNRLVYLHKGSKLFLQILFLYFTYKFLNLVYNYVVYPY